MDSKERSKQRERDKKNKSRSNRDNKDENRERRHRKENGTDSDRDVAKKRNEKERKEERKTSSKSRPSDERRKEKSSDDRRKEKSSDERRKEKSSDERRKEKSSDDRRKEKTSDDRRKEKSSDKKRRDSKDNQSKDARRKSKHSEEKSKERSRDPDRKHKSKSEHSSRKSEKHHDSKITDGENKKESKPRVTASDNQLSNEIIDNPMPEKNTNLDGREKIIEREKSMLEIIQKNIEEDEEEDYNYDDEEFDDYDDDFESEVEDDESEQDSTDDSEMSLDDQDSDYDSVDDNKVANAISDTHRNQIKEAMALENARVGSNTPPGLPSSPANTPVPSDDNKESQKSRKSARGLDFAAAQKTQEVNKAMSKSVKRGNDLMRLVELDTVSFDLFELKPQTEYEIYMKSFGKSDTQQQYTQYNEDYLDKEVMTEPSDVKTCWTQHPMEGSTATAYEGESVDEESKLGTYNPLTLSKFVSISTQIMVTLLEERASRHGYTTTFKPIQSKISDTAASYPTNEICSGRAPIFAAPISSQSFLVLYTKPRTESGVPYTGMSCSWNLQNTNEPMEVLVSNAAHRCACISPYNQNLIFVGCEDGSVNLWDLNEPANMHMATDLSNTRYTLRLPTYNTCGIQVAESHNSKITNLQPIKFEQEHDKSQMSSFQIASLDENGSIIIWVVVTVTDPSLSGSQTDLGLRPGGKVKLVKSASINVNFPQDKMIDLFPELRTFAFRQHYSDASTYFVTTDKGAIIKASRNQSLPQPVYFSEAFSVPSIVGSIDFNKFNWKYFLSGSSDGSVCLYYLNQPHPIVTWDRTTRGRPVRTVQWSEYSSTVFYVMDSANKLYMWDLSIRDSTPVAIESYDEKGLLYFTEMSKSAGSKSPIVLLCFKDGSLEAHHVKEEAMNNQVNNVTKLEQYLSSVS